MFELETNLIFWSWVSFGALFFLLWKFVLPPLSDVLAKRKELIEQSLKSAKEQENRSKELLEEYQEKMDSASKETSQLLDKARQESEEFRQRTISAAREESSRMLAKVKIETDRMKEDVFEETKKRLAEHVALAAQKLIGRVLSEEEQKRSVGASLIEAEEFFEKHKN